jgi:hypothetical protein
VSFLASKPALDDGGMILARAYAKVSTCRAIGAAGLGPVPVTAIWDWLDRNGITDPALCRHVEDVLGAVDAAAMRRANRPPAAEGPNIKAPPKSKAPPRRTRKP